MNEQKEGGGAAFPLVAESGLGRINEGMTLRDYFATHAPQPPKWWMDSYAKQTQDLDTYAAVITQWNYTYADSMLEARKK